ncbi:hypothetical protein MRX96_056571 [Rhipicephalus microplus]
MVLVHCQGPPKGNTAKGQLAVHVMTPPVVNPGSRTESPSSISGNWGRPLPTRTTTPRSYRSRGVRQLHSGNYTCVASNPAASANYTAPMVVQVPPTWRQEPVDKAAIMGQVVIFDCQADGFPVPVIRWKKEYRAEGGRDFAVIISNANVQILENGSLSIREADRSDAGHYMCQALNGVGPGISTVVKLDIHVAAHFERKFQALTSRRGDSVVLTCRAVGEQPITVTWTKDRHGFNPALEPRYAVEEKPSADGFEYVIRIPSVDRRDSSLFSCYAENAYGRDDTNFQVVVQEPPDKPRGLEATQITSRSVTLSWSPAYSGNSPVLKYLLEHKLREGFWEQDSHVSVIESTEFSHVASGLRPKTSYEFRLRAENSIGLSECSDTLVVTTEEEAPTGAPQNIRVTPTGSRSLHVSWKPPLDDESNGLVQGYYVGYRVRNAKDSFAYKTLESSANSVEQQCELTDLRRNTRYSVVVQAFNAKGAGPASEEIFSQTLEIDPPAAPRLRLVSSTSSSVHLSWDIEKDQPINGFVLFHKAEPPVSSKSESAEETGEWTEVQTGAERSAYAFRGLRCGRKYAFHAIAFNAAGRGAQQQHSAGQDRRLNPDSTRRARPPPVQRYFVPATWYDLLVTAQNDAGATEAGYIFATLTISGGTVPPPQWTQAVESQRRHIHIILPTVCSLFVVILLAAAVCYVFCRRRDTTMQRPYSASVDEVTETTKSMDTVPMSVWEGGETKQESETTQHRRAVEHEQLYYPSPYATRGGRLSSLYATGGLQSGWASARSLNSATDEAIDERMVAQHTYDVPFARRPSSPEVKKMHKQSDGQGHVLGSTQCLPESIYTKSAPLYTSPEKYKGIRKSLEALSIIEGYPNTNVAYVYSRPKKKHWSTHGDELYAEHKLRKLSRYADGLKQAELDLHKGSAEFSSIESHETSEAECDMHARRFASQR